jgi:tetratricopeptide (TPR) repeat protein
MTAHESQQTPVTPRQRGWRRGLYLLLVLLIPGALVGWYQWRQYHRVEVPAPDLTGADPAVTAAIAAAQEKVQQKPRSSDAWGTLGLVLLAHDFGTEANACFAQAERLDPDEPRWPYLQGLGLRLQELDTAILKLRRAVELCPLPTPRLRLAEYLREQGHPDEAESFFRRVLEVDADNPLALLGLAQLASEQGKLQDSLTYLRPIQNNPCTKRAALALLAEIHQKQGHNAQAAEEARRAAQLPPDQNWPDPFVNEARQFQVGKRALLLRGGELLKSGQVDRAAQLFQRVTVDYPTEDRGWLMLGRCRLMGKDWTGAEKDFRKAVQLAPASTEAEFYLGVALFQQENIAEAVQHFRRATELNPGYPLAQYNLGQSVLRQGDREAARQAFLAAIHHHPQFQPAHAALGELLASEGKLAEAEKYLRQALQLDPQDQQARHRLEQLERKDGAGKLPKEPPSPE